jgi:hypothetical protein
MDLFGSTARKAAILRKQMLADNPTEVFAKMLAKKTDEELLAKYPEHHARRLEMMRERRPQAGFAALLSMMIACAVMLILLAAFLPNSLRSAQVANNASAASFLSLVNTAEAQYSTYGGYVQPYALAGSVQARVAGAAGCANPMLLPGTIVGSAAMPAAPVGYTMSFAGGTAAAFACVGGPTAAYQNYSINLAPISKIQAGGINFFTCVGTGCDGQVHYASGRAAVETDPVWSTTIAGTVGGSGSSGSTSPSTPTVILTGPWSGSATYAAGQEVLYTSGANVGIYANLTGQNSATNQNPAGDATNWIKIGSYSTAPPSLGGSFSGVPLSGGSFYTCPLVGINCSVVITSGTIPNNYTTIATSFTMTQFTVTMSPQNGGSALSIYTQPLPNPSGPANLGCTIPAYGTTCTVNLSPVVLPAGSQMEIVVTPGLSLPATSLTWTIS